MLCKEVTNYISAAKGLPFFYVVGDKDYKTVFEEFRQAGVSFVRMSDFCLKDDRFPSIDDLVDYFRTLDIDYRDNKYVIIGLGEYLAIRGVSMADKELRRLKSTTLGNARVILLLRGVGTQATNIILDDARMMEQQRAYISKDCFCSLSITNVSIDADLISNKGFKKLLREFEDGECTHIYASTQLSLDNSLISIAELNSTFDIVKMIVPDLKVELSAGTDDQWAKLEKDLNKCNRNLDQVFYKYGIDDSLYDELYETIAGFEYKNWLAFLYLKQNGVTISNSYLKTVVDYTQRFSDFKENVLNYIIELSHNDDHFQRMYDERKKLVKSFPEEEIAIFMRANEVDPKESIYRFTDNTMIERKAVIKWISAYGVNDAVSYVYPALAAYLKKYIFESTVLSEELTEYFDEYKRQKVTNRIDEEFIKRVEEYASRLLYAKLPTRNNAIMNVKDKENAYLYWIDALGVEYLSYIRELANKKGLSVHVDITRSDIPTITAINKQFYESWIWGKKYKEEQLDNIKHKEKGGYFFTDEEVPIYIASELQVIEKAVSTAATELAWHRCKSFVIASDHGASRLAVIRRQESPYETDTGGEHFGRCCKTFENCDVVYKVEENGYIVLTDYGRFKKSQPAKVEVHGGASLEEIVVPVITLTLKKQAGVSIKVIHFDDIVADRHDGVTLQLYISDVEYPNSISLVIEDKKYAGIQEDSTHFSFELKDIKRAKTKPYTAEVFDSSDLIGNISFKVKGKTATMNDDFDFGSGF